MQPSVYGVQHNRSHLKTQAPTEKMHMSGPRPPISAPSISPFSTMRKHVAWLSDFSRFASSRGRCASSGLGSLD